MHFESLRPYSIDTDTIFPDVVTPYDNQWYAQWFTNSQKGILDRDAIATKKIAGFYVENNGNHGFVGSETVAQLEVGLGAVTIVPADRPRSLADLLESVTLQFPLSENNRFQVIYYDDLPSNEQA